jgi:hypothetical protein
MESRCCSKPDQLCFGKNATYALCSTASDCEGTCDALPRLSSLFCFAVFRVKTYEMGLIELQLDRGIGIFACDETMLLADTNMSLGIIRRHGKDVPVRTHTFKQMPVGLSQDGSAANTALFMKVWDVVIDFGAYRRHAWTLKVDPDAVLVPDRARQHVLKYAGQTVYVVNCNKYPDSNNFPMMYGPVEIFSKEAIEKYKELGWHCATELDWSLWGEDYYLTHCLDHIHVTRVNDFELVGDASCTGAVCSDSMSAAFHPFKDVKTWVDCLDDALQTKRPIKYKYVDAISFPEADDADDGMDIDDIDAGEGWCCSFATDTDDQCGTCQGKFDDDNWCATSQTECEACQKSWCHDSDTETTTKKKAGNETTTKKKANKAKASTSSPKTSTAAPEANNPTDDADDDMDIDDIDAGEGWCCSFATDTDDQCGTCQGKFDDDNWCAASQTECEACKKSWCHDSDTEMTIKKKASNETTTKKKANKAKASTSSPKTSTAAPEATATTAAPSTPPARPKPPPVNEEIITKYETFRSLGPQRAGHRGLEFLGAAHGARG